MDNKAIANILYETADLLEIDGQDSFRIRSYRNAAEAIEAFPNQIADLISEPKKVLEIPGVGKGMLANFQEILKEGRLSVHADLLKKYHHSMLQLLKIQGLGPKTIALMTSDQLPANAERHTPVALSLGPFGPVPEMGTSFGLGFAVGMGPAATAMAGSGGEFYWGGAASTAFWVDPTEDLFVVFMTQLFPSVAYPFRAQLRALVYQAIDD